MYKIEPLERKDYDEVFSTSPLTKLGVDVVKTQLESVFPPVGTVVRDSNNDIVGVSVIYNYGITDTVPKGPFRIDGWITEACTEDWYMRLRLVEEAPHLIRDEDTSVFDVTPTTEHKEMQEYLSGLYQGMSDNIFVKDERIYLQNKEGKINEGRKWK